MDPFNLQRQVRNNSSDLVNFCEELKQWGEEMKRKDETLKTGTEAAETETPLPRNKVRKTSDSSNPKPKKGKSKSKSSKRLNSSDYSSWEKFDVEAECAKLDEEKPAGYESGELTDEYDENAHDEAVYEKEKGNKFVKLQKWDQAIECYTTAIQYYGYDPVFYANRALCYLKKQNYRGAETDCTNALKLDKTYVKAYQRRAAAREALNQLTEAHSDLLKVFDYEPNNKESKANLTKLEKKLESFNEKVCMKKPEAQRPKSKFTIARKEHKQLKSFDIQNQAVASTSQSQTTERTDKNSGPSQVPKIAPYWPSGNEVELVETVYKPPHLRSKMPLKRIEILDADGIEFDASSEIREVETKPVEKTQNRDAWPQPNDNRNFINCDDLKIVERKIPECNSREKEKPRKESKFSKEKNNKKIISNTNKTEKTVEANEFNYPVPETSVQFNYDWRLLKSKSEWRYVYLKRVDPKKIATIFKESLDCDIFSGIIHTLAEMFVDKKVPVYEYLLGLCEVKRFSMLAMFMSDDDKKNMFKLLDYMRADNSLTKEHVDNLMQKYGI